jgi:hypothetical protein
MLDVGIPSKGGREPRKSPRSNAVNASKQGLTAQQENTDAGSWLVSRPPPAPTPPPAIAPTESPSPPPLHHPPGPSYLLQRLSALSDLAALNKRRGRLRHGRNARQNEQSRPQGPEGPPRGQGEGGGMKRPRFFRGARRSGTRGPSGINEQRHAHARCAPRRRRAPLTRCGPRASRCRARRRRTRR